MTGLNQDLYEIQNRLSYEMVMTLENDLMALKHHPPSFVFQNRKKIFITLNVDGLFKLSEDAEAAILKLGKKSSLTPYMGYKFIAEMEFRVSGTELQLLRYVHRP